MREEILDHGKTREHLTSNENTKLSEVYESLFNNYYSGEQLDLYWLGFEEKYPNLASSIVEKESSETKEAVFVVESVINEIVTGEEVSYTDVVEGLLESINSLGESEHDGFSVASDNIPESITVTQNDTYIHSPYRTAIKLPTAVFQEILSLAQKEYEDEANDRINSLTDLSGHKYSPKGLQQYFE